MVYILIIAIVILIFYFTAYEAMSNSYKVTHTFHPENQMESSDTNRTIYPVYGYIDKYQVIKPVRM